MNQLTRRKANWPIIAVLFLTALLLYQCGNSSQNDVNKQDNKTLKQSRNNAISNLKDVSFAIAGMT
jgi:hypothetical protein